jgi:branched-chain amino acid transport system ATP-binding protein
LALQAADRAYIIRNGEIEMEGSAGSFLQDEKVKKAYLAG